MDNFGKSGNEKHGITMDINKRYNKLNSNLTLEANRTPKAHIPTPTEKDYKRGYIIRYFVQRANDNFTPIFEVNSTEYNQLRRTSIFSSTSLRWRISGSPNPVYNLIDELKDMGVLKSNEVAIHMASTVMNKLQLYLPNLLQFHQ